jgi:hypothetical protein
MDVSFNRGGGKPECAPESVMKSITWRYNVEGLGPLVIVLDSGISLGQEADLLQPLG